MMEYRISKRDFLVYYIQKRISICTDILEMKPFIEEGGTGAVNGRLHAAAGYAALSLVCLASLLDEGGRGSTSLLVVQAVLLVWSAVWIGARLAGAVPGVRAGWLKGDGYRVAVGVK